MPKAVIDVGSNSVLLLVAEGGHTLYESSAVTSLGEGTKKTGLLSEAGMTRTLDALRTAFDDARAHGATEVKAAATMAARIASNTPEFQKRAEAQGTPVEVLSGDDEAELGFRTVADDPTFADSDRISIVDVGGQSTELVTADRRGSGWDKVFHKSFPVGTLALKDNFLSAESPDGPAVFRASAYLDELLHEVHHSGGTPVALGATGTNLVTIRDGITVWDPERVHGQWLHYGEIGSMVGRLMPLTDAQRAAIPGMEPGREKTLPAGVLILERFLNALSARGCAVSVRGWRHAMLERL
jgi:exopolyphosphatase/guanosine-5'-triphosphate,3'-diphosphate pyrophosphatase